jgi:hypothetical protein
MPDIVLTAPDGTDLRDSLACQRKAELPDRCANAGSTRRLQLAARPRADRDHRSTTGVDRFEISALSIPCR